LISLAAARISKMNCAFASKLNLNNLRMKSEFRPPRFKKYSLRRPQISVLLQDTLLFYCTLYTDCPDGRTDAVARHVSFLSFFESSDIFYLLLFLYESCVYDRTLHIVNKTMLRRKPTRIEMKIEDISEWMAVKKENENKKQAAAEAGPQQGDSQAVHKTRREIVHERIGYDPRAATGRETTMALPRPLH